MGNVCTASEGQAPCRQATLGAGKFIWEMCVLHQRAWHHLDRLPLGQVITRIMSTVKPVKINLLLDALVCL